MREFTIRLVGHDSPSGSIRSWEALELADAVRVLVYRLTREAADHSGLGRTTATVESLGQVALGIAAEGHAMHFHLGDPSSLVDDPFAGEVDAQLRLLLRSMAKNLCPSETSFTIAQAMDDLVRALERIAPQVELLQDGYDAISVETRLVSREPWKARASATPTKAVLTGRLEMVDVATAHFRIRTEDGEKIELFEVADAPSAARLVGTPVQTEGLFLRGDGQRHHRLEQVSVVSRDESEGPLTLFFDEPRTPAGPFVPIAPHRNLWPELTEPVQDELPV